MDNITFRTLTKEDIECRVSQVKNGKVQILLYKNARTDADILDETVGAENWQDKFYECKGNLYCSVGICTEENGWIWKDDCGSESNMEAEKGEASDAFKRACFKWGIGRTELYNTPPIWVKGEDSKIIKDGSKEKCYDKFIVEKIAFDEKKYPIGIAIYNASQKKRCFVWQKGGKA